MISTSSKASHHRCFGLFLLIIVVIAKLSEIAAARGVLYISPRCHTKRSKSIKHNIAAHVNGVDLGSRGVWCNDGNFERFMWTKSRRVNGNSAKVHLYGQRRSHNQYVCMYVCVCILIRPMVVVAGFPVPAAVWLIFISVKDRHESSVWFIGGRQPVQVCDGLNAIVCGDNHALCPLLCDMLETFHSQKQS